MCIQHFLKKSCTKYAHSFVFWGYLGHRVVYLHPEEESFGSCFKLQHINSSGCALIHPFELAVVGKDDQILNEGKDIYIFKNNINRLKYKEYLLPTSSTFPVVRSFQQKWMSESSVCWMYTWPLRLSGVTVLPFMVILPARNSTRYLLEEPRDPDTMLGNRAPDAIMVGCWKDR